MTTTMSIRELTRSGGKIAEYDYIDIEDRKTHEYKGVFVSAKYADEVKAFLKQKEKQEKQKRLDEIMRFVGKGSIEPRFEGLTSSQIKEKIAKEKHGT